MRNLGVPGGQIRVFPGLRCRRFRLIPGSGSRGNSGMVVIKMTNLGLSTRPTSNYDSHSYPLSMLSSKIMDKFILQAISIYIFNCIYLFCILVTTDALLDCLSRKLFIKVSHNHTVDRQSRTSASIFIRNENSNLTKTRNSESRTQT